MLIAFDGACKNNGKADCVSVGAAYWLQDYSSSASYEFEKGSTNQRGELQGLLCALQACLTHGKKDEGIWIISDSAYIVNAITNNWLMNWQMKGWKTAEGADVKNKDLWLLVADLLMAIDEAGLEFAMYHVKGHVLSIGPVTLQNIAINKLALLEELRKFFRSKIDTKTYNKDRYAQALGKFNTLNGVDVMLEVFDTMLVINSVVDALAVIKLNEITNQGSYVK